MIVQPQVQWQQEDGNTCLKQVRNDNYSNSAEDSRSGKARSSAGARRISIIPSFASQQASNRIVHARNVGNVYICVIESSSSELKYVREGGIGIAAIKASEIPVEFYSTQGGVVRIERVVCCASEIGGDNPADETRPYLVTLGIILGLVECDKNQGILHKCGVGKVR